MTTLSSGATYARVEPGSGAVPERKPQQPLPEVSHSENEGVALNEVPASMRASGANCGEILQQGLFNTELLTINEQNQHAFLDWQCSTDIGTHDEARAKGFSLGVPIYGVPLEAGATFSSQQKDTWKKEHCSLQQLQASSTLTYYNLQRYASPDIVQAWEYCVNRPGLRCYVDDTTNSLTFSANWAPTSQYDTHPPQVFSFTASNASCQGPQMSVLSQGAQINIGGVVVQCGRPNPDAGYTFTLNTSNGHCSVSRPPKACGQKGQQCCSNQACGNSLTCEDNVCREPRRFHTVQQSGSAATKGRGRGGSAHSGGIWVEAKCPVNFPKLVSCDFRADGNTDGTHPFDMPRLHGNDWARPTTDFLNNQCICEGHHTWKRAFKSGHWINCTSIATCADR